MKMILGVAFGGIALISGCSSSDTSSDPAPAAQQPPPPSSYTVLVTGTLKADEPDSKAAHDGIVSGARDQAAKLGDVAHGAFLTADTRKDYLAIDRWTSHDGLTSFFANPDVQKGFGTLFATAPQTSVWQPRTEWTQWGEPSLLTGGGTKYIFTFRGQVKGSEAESRAAHNQVVDQGRAAANQLGDVAHFVFAGDSDPNQILGIDVWTNLEGAQKFFGDPAFQQASASIYATPPVVQTWGTTDWTQW